LSVSRASAPATTRGIVGALVLAAMVGLVVVDLSDRIGAVTDGLVEDRRQAVRTLERLHRITAADPRPADVIAADLAALIVTAPTASSASAAALDHVRMLLSHAAAVAERLDTGAGSRRDGRAQVEVRARFRADVAALQRVLHRLESGPPRFVVSALTVEALGEGRLVVELTATVPWLAPIDP
jgi:hypothetical protein